MESKEQEGTAKHEFTPSRTEAEASHKFWDTQPVPRLSTLITKGEQQQQGPIDPPKTVDDIRDTPYKLPASLEWVSVDLNDEEWAQEVYRLLTENYVEDDDSMFRFDYSIPFLRWALMPPGYIQDWHIGVSIVGKKRLVGFITGIPARINVSGDSIMTAEINFLCVYKNYREKRLAPLLIKEVTRRVNRLNIWQAVYTAGVVLPSPVAQARYYHRSLDPVKLVDIGFTRFGPRLNNSRALKLYKLPPTSQLPGQRVMTPEDVPAVHALLREYLQHFSLYLEFSVEEVEYFLLPRDRVIYSYVVEGEGGKITDFYSFYLLPSSVLKSARHTHLNAAYAYYMVPGRYSLLEIFRDMLIMAKSQGFDVFNALDIMDNMRVFKELKFGVGDGNLQYYLYNWRTNSMVPTQLGMVLV